MLKIICDQKVTTKVCFKYSPGSQGSSDIEPFHLSKAYAIAAA